MTNALKTTLAALLATTVSTAAFAQTDMTATSGADQTPAEELADTQMGQPVDDGVNIGALIADLANGSVETEGDLITAVGSPTQIDTILLSELRAEAANSQTSIDDVLAAQQDQLADIRGVIGDNSVLSGALAEDGYEVDDVVAFHRSEERGQLVFIIDDTAM